MASTNKVDHRAVLLKSENPVDVETMMEMEIYTTVPSHKGTGDDNSLTDAQESQESDLPDWLLDAETTVGSGVIEISEQQADQDKCVVTIRQAHTLIATFSRPVHRLQAPVACHTSSSMGKYKRPFYH